MRADVRIEERRDPVAVRVLLQALPDWFGRPEAVEGYVADAADPSLTSLCAVDPFGVVGVALLARPFPESGNLHLLAVARQAHRRGVGRALVDRAAADLAREGRRYLTVHTVGPSFADEHYARTRAFYRATGFVPLEEHHGLDWPGPTVIMVRALEPAPPAAIAR